MSHWLTLTARRRHQAVNIDQVLYPLGHAVLLEMTVAKQMHISIEANAVLYFVSVCYVSHSLYGEADVVN